jgi:hypothetical protein
MGVVGACRDSFVIYYCEVVEVTALHVLFVGIGAILIDKGINQYFDGFVDKWYLLFILAGILFWVYSSRLNDLFGMKNGWFKLVGIVLIFVGLGPFYVKYLVGYPYVFIIVGSVLMIFSKQIEELVHRG